MNRKEKQQKAQKPCSSASGDDTGPTPKKKGYGHGQVLYMKKIIVFGVENQMMKDTQIVNMENFIE